MAQLRTNIPWPTDPWVAAKARFLEGLPDDQKTTLENTSLEDLFYRASAGKKNYEVNSKLLSIQRKLAPFIDAVEDYSKAMDVFANSSAILCPLWGSVRVVLHIAQGFGRYFDQLQDMFAHIGDNLPRFRVFQKLFSRHERLLASISNAYLDVIAFCVEVKELFIKARKTSIAWSITCRVLWKSFQQRFEDHLSRFRMHKGRVEEEAALSHMIEAKKARELELAARALQERERRETKCRKHLALLSSYDYRKAHQKVRDQRHTGTGLWLRYDMKFRAWADSPNSDCLPCFGIPGSGKTILASTLLDELIPEYSNGSSACCFHYCDYTDCDTLDIVVILGSLIKQLLQPFDIPMEIGEKISRLYREGTSSPTRLELQSLLFQVLQRYRHTLVVIDGIDELSKADQATIIEIAHRASRSEETVVKVFVTSRSEEPYIRRSLKSYNQIELSAAVIANDVKCFVKDSVEARIESGEIVVRNPGLKMEITNALVDGAKDMFLWVRFQLDEISEAATDDAIRMAIQNLPKDLAETYARILTKIWNSAGGSSKFDLAKQIFKWVICARRPLTVEELSEAMAVSVDCDSLDINKVPSGDGYHLLQACGNLLNVDRNDQTVRLAHHTVGKFLVSDQPQFATYGSLHFTQSKAEADIGVMCVTYLSFSDFETQIVKKGSLSMIVNVSTIQSNIWRRIPCGNTVRSVLSATRRSSTLAEEDAFLIRLAGHQSQDPLVQAPQRKYVLLEYIASFWAWHTSHFEESTVSEKTWNLFRELAFDRQFLFDAKPWDTMETRAAKIDKSVPHIPLLRWTIDEGVASFVRLIFHTGNGYNPDLDFEKFHVYFSHERKNGMNLLVRASQKENNQTFDLLLHYISIKDFPHRNFLENSDMLLEVASLSNSHLKKLTHMGGDSLSPSIQLALNKAIERGNALSVQRLVSAGGRVDFFGSSHSLKRNASASFLEVAAATGKSERIGLLCQYNPPGNLIIRAARLTIDRNHQEAFLTLLACYLHYGPWVGTFLLSASSNQLEGSKNQLHELLSSLPSDSADFLGRRDIINACQRAGIVVRLATDEVCGARHYAEMIGILAKGGIVLDASSFRSHMSQQQYNGLPFLQVLSDCDDQDIHFLAESLRESGKVVGISRVLSLLKEDRRKSADITMDI